MMPAPRSANPLPTEILAQIYWDTRQDLAKLLLAPLWVRQQAAVHAERALEILHYRRQLRTARMKARR